MRTILVTACLVFAFRSVCSQTQQGMWEFSLSGSLGSVSSLRETSGSGGSSKSESEPQGYLSLLLRPGFYITDGLVVEPEILWTAFEGVPPSFSFSGNLAYNVNIPEFTLFVLGGYGTGNAVPLFQRLFFRASDKLDISLLNVGGGFKFFLGEHTALRIEYRYQRYYQEETFSFGSFSSTTKRTTNFHNVFFGFSLFVP